MCAFVMCALVMFVYSEWQGVGDCACVNVV